MPDPAPHRVYLVFSLGITPHSVQKLLTECAGLANSGVKEIYLLFASTGGNVAAGILAYNTLRALPVKLFTHNIGNVDSIASIIFLAGEERLAVPHATFMFHGVAFDLTGPLRADQPYLTDRLESITADHKKMASIIKERAEFDQVEDIVTLFSTQATRDTEYALTHKIIHKIEHLKIPSDSKTLVFSD